MSDNSKVDKSKQRYGNIAYYRGNGKAEYLIIVNGHNEN